jgi:hypothetical protein
MIDRRIVLATFVVLAAPLGACTTTTDTTISSSGSTALALTPGAFLGDVACSAQAGSMRSYVATLFDVTDVTSPDYAEEHAEALPLPSSEPTSCTSYVTFNNIAIGHFYTVVVDGYEEDPATLVASGGRSSGSRHMVFKSSRKPVTPRWNGRCGNRPARGIEAEEGVALAFYDCSGLNDTGTQDSTAIVVDPTVANTTLSCAKRTPTGADGGIVRYSITSPELGDIGDLSCLHKSVATYTTGVTAGTTYHFRVTAEDADHNPIAYASCTATAEEGTSVAATCTLLTTTGSLELSPSALPKGGTQCVADVDAGAITSAVFPCALGARIAPLDPGPHVATVRGLTATGDNVFTTTCSGVVSAANVTLATCK